MNGSTQGAATVSLEALGLLLLQEFHIKVKLEVCFGERESSSYVYPLFLFLFVKCCN